MKRYLFAFTILTLFCTAYKGYAQEKAVPPLDIVLVLDNSGSMKKNDPEFLTRKMVSSFLDGLSSDSRIGFIIFADKTELVMPLTLVAEKETREKVTMALDKVDYSGQYTNIPAAIERGIYELNQNGRKGAEKLIIFMTDGIIDTGDRANDIEKHRWLKDELAEESKRSGIRIFGIAFTDQADFELIQTLGQKTDGGYYRALKAEDIQGIFNSIKETIIPKLKPEPPPQPPVKVVVPDRGEKKGFPKELAAMAAVAGLMVLGIAIAVVIMRKRRKVEVEAEAGQDLSVPEAELWDINEEHITDKLCYKLNKKIITIGRVKGEDIDICINKETVSASHAQIRYEDRDNSFYLIDLGSTNGTYLNREEERIPKYVPIPLKSGDVIALTHPDEYKFEFLMPGQGKRGYTKIVRWVTQQARIRS